VHPTRDIHWIADAHGYGKRFIVRADEMLTAFLELQRAIYEFAVGFDLVMPCRSVRANEKLTALLNFNQLSTTRISH
jgi:hypothetical protein